MVRDAYKKVDIASDCLVLVAGDADFVPAVRQLTVTSQFVYVFDRR